MPTGDEPLHDLMEVNFRAPRLGMIHVPPVKSQDSYERPPFFIPLSGRSGLSPQSADYMISVESKAPLSRPGPDRLPHPAKWADPLAPRRVLMHPSHLPPEPLRRNRLKGVVDGRIHYFPEPEPECFRAWINAATRPPSLRGSCSLAAGRQIASWKPFSAFRSRSPWHG